MAKERSHTEKTGAGDKSIGFDYQYYYFLHRILNLGVGQSAGLEIKDDVHTELDADFNILYQVKHTVQTDASGAPVALTELDADLWKTLYNWSQVISDKVEGRGEIAAQLEFVNKTEFHLVSNKSQKDSNKFLRLIIDFQEGNEKFKALNDHLKGLTTEDASIKKYIQAVVKLNGAVRQKFFENIRFELGLDDIIARVKRSITETFVDEKKVNYVFERLDSSIASDNFIAVKNGVMFRVSFEDFTMRYGKIFEEARTKKLVHYPFVPEVPDDIFAQTFIKRLIDIGDLSSSDVEDAVEYTTYKLRLSKHLDIWVQIGDLVQTEVVKFHSDAALRWKNEFKGTFRGCNSEEKILDAANELLKILRRQNFILDETTLDLELSNGELYFLSDARKIGWHKDWEQHD
ncbi:hypothetical protein EHZ19_15640 [Paraburkholderia bannensis]|nr:hypothetical protein [Paraburkholderia bannensis]RQM47085.1 hypothetical protein EHZ19_15640 [Paraburkholderia bannensis]